MTHILHFISDYSNPTVHIFTAEAVGSAGKVPPMDSKVGNDNTNKLTFFCFLLEGHLPLSPALSYKTSPKNFQMNPHVSFEFGLFDDIGGLQKSASAVSSVGAAGAGAYGWASAGGGGVD